MSLLCDRPNPNVPGVCRTIPVGGGAGPTMTVVTQTTTSTTTTTILAPTIASTTTTTLPPGCGVRTATFESIDCRFGLLVKKVGETRDLGKGKKRLLAGVTAARTKSQDAERDIAAARGKDANKAFQKSIDKMGKFTDRLRSAMSRKSIPSETRNELIGDAVSIAEDLKTLRHELRAKRRE